MTKLKELKGVGQVTIEKMSEAGVDDIDDLADASPEQLSSQGGISEQKASQLIRRANRMAVSIDTGEEVRNERQNREIFTTGLEDLDDILNGGFRSNQLVTLAGTTGTGKTQVSFNACAEAVEQKDKPAVYIETEPERYSPKRLQQLSSEDDTQPRVHRIEAHDLEQQILAYEKIKKSDTDFSLIALDSFSSNFRLSDKFEGRADFSERSTEVGKHLRKLREMAEAKQTPVVITAQVYGSPDGFGSPHAVYGGSLFMHTVNFFIMMKKSQGSLRKAKVLNHPEVDDDEIYFNIKTNDIESMQDV